MKSFSFKIVSPYFFLGLFWIFLSDYFLTTIALQTEEAFFIQLAKGGAFVLATSLLLYYLVKRNSTKLQEREAYLYSLLHSQSTFLIRIDLQGHYSFVNQAFCHKYGYEQKEIIGQSYKNFVVPEDHEKVQHALETYSGNTGKVVPIKIQRLSREGGRYITNWEFVAITNAKGEVKEFQGIGHDITQEKELEAEVERYEQNLSALINNTEDVIWSVDVDLRLISANQTFYKSIHRETGRNIEKGDEVFLFAIEEEQREKWKQRYQRALQGEQYRFINHRVSKTGEESYIETSFNPIINKGKVIGVACIARDITEIKKNENKLLQHNQILREIAYMQSHKLRRPVATILSLVALFDKENPSSELNVLLLDKLEIVCQELDTVIHEIVGKTYELD